MNQALLWKKNLRPKYWDVEKFYKSIIAAIKEEKNQEEEGQHTKEIQRRTWDPGITWLKILKEHLEDMGYWNRVAQDF
ncbi:hypothetical protein Tco_0326202, partial [Tanacetum coccineum]